MQRARPVVEVNRRSLAVCQCSVAQSERGSEIDLIELNEAFASQSLAVIRKLGLDPSIVNINGGAIALGHPLGCTGCKLTIQIVQDLKRLKKKYGMVTACVGGGQGIAGIIEYLG
jgi:acetyl-CoA acyltransferase